MEFLSTPEYYNQCNRFNINVFSIILFLLTETSIVSSEPQEAIYCMPFLQGASLACETGKIMVTQAHLGNISDRRDGFCENPIMIPEYRRYYKDVITDILRKNCNTFTRCALNTVGDLTNINGARYVYAEYQCLNTPTDDAAYFHLYGDKMASGNAVVIQTMGYPSNDVIIKDTVCTIKNHGTIPSIRLDIYDFSTNASGDRHDEYCIEYYEGEKRCSKLGGQFSTVIFKPGIFMIKKNNENPLTTRLYMIMHAIDTPDGRGAISDVHFNLTCEPMVQGMVIPLPPAPNSSNKKDNLPIILGGVIGGVALIAVTAVLFVLIVRRKRKEDPLKNYSTVFQYNVNTARRLGAQDTLKRYDQKGDGIYDELDNIQNIYSNDSVMADYRVSQISPYVTSHSSGEQELKREMYSVVTNNGIFAVSNGGAGTDVTNSPKINSKVTPPNSVMDKTASDIKNLYSMPNKTISPKPKPPVPTKPKVEISPNGDKRYSHSNLSKSESDTSYSLTITENDVYKY